jgi:acetyl esterase/lipase
MSASMAASRALLRLTQRRGGGDLLAELRGRDYPQPAPVPRSLRATHEVEESVVAGIPVVRLTPRAGRSGQHLIYTHGGAYVRPMLGAHWLMVAAAVRGTGATVTLPMYRLAPEGCAADAYPALRAVYEQVVAEAGPDAVTLGGDSAGGGLALGQAIDHRTRGLPAARQVLLFAPWLDLELRHPGVAALQPHDAMLRVDLLRVAGRLWARDQDPQDPLLSPIRADLAGLPPVHLFQGGRDVLAADARDLAVRLRSAGNTGTATWVDGGFHVYVAATWTPEARRAFGQVRALLSA